MNDQSFYEVEQDAWGDYCKRTGNPHLLTRPLRSKLFNSDEDSGMVQLVGCDWWWAESELWELTPNSINEKNYIISEDRLIRKPAKLLRDNEKFLLDFAKSIILEYQDEMDSLTMEEVADGAVDSFIDDCDDMTDEETAYYSEADNYEFIAEIKHRLGLLGVKEAAFTATMQIMIKQIEFVTHPEVDNSKSKEAAFKAATRDLELVDFESDPDVDVRTSFVTDE